MASGKMAKLYLWVLDTSLSGDLLFEKREGLADMPDGYLQLG
jgi:hypothetical protein